MQPGGEGQIIGGVIVSRSGRSYDGGGAAAIPIVFHRELIQTYTEYGWRKNLTLFLATETAHVTVEQSGVTPFQGIDNAFEGGARFLLGRDDFSVLSLETSLRSGGAFNFAVSANSRTGGLGGQLRLLYGRGFKMGRRDGFVDIELGHIFMSGQRPDETPLDLTTGLWLTPNNMIMLQSFNLFGPAGTIAAYPSFDSHKLQLSWVMRLSGRYRLQAGAFLSPFGRNALAEEGLSLSLWRRF